MPTLLVEPSQPRRTQRGIFVPRFEDESAADEPKTDFSAVHAVADPVAPKQSATPVERHDVPDVPPSSPEVPVRRVAMPPAHYYC